MQSTLLQEWKAVVKEEKLTSHKKQKIIWTAPEVLLQGAKWSLKTKVHGLHSFLMN